MYNNFFKKKFKIGNFVIGKKPFIIAEIGSNHNGSLNLAIQHILEAKKSGANAVKFQIFESDFFYKKKDKNYQLLKKYEFKKNWIKRIKKICKQINIYLIFSIFNYKDVKLIKEFKLGAIKIASSEVTNKTLLIEAAKSNLPILLSTGMSEFSEIIEALEIIKYNKNDKVALMQCSSIYPASDKELNLNVIDEYKKIFSFPIGYSDHSTTLISSMAAVAKGAIIVEKHFTVNKKFEGPDHFYSLEKKEFKEMVKNIKKIQLMLGNNTKYPLVNELKYCRRKGIYAKININKNDKISLTNTLLKQPQTKSISSKYSKYIVNFKLKKNIVKDQPIDWDDIL
jgi:sialic acid synthase SpsE